MKKIILLSVIITLALVGCGGGGDDTPVNNDGYSQPGTPSSSPPPTAGQPPTTEPPPTTQPPPATQPFDVVSISPTNNQTGVDSKPTIVIEFSDSVDASSVNVGSGTSLDTVKLFPQSNSGASVPLTKTVSGNRVTLSVLMDLQPKMTYTLNVLTSVRSASGVPLSGFKMTQFTTGQFSAPGDNALFFTILQDGTDAVDYYEIFFGTGSRNYSGSQRLVTNPPTPVAPVTQGNHTFETVFTYNLFVPNQEYFFAVAACNDTGCSDYSNEIKDVP